MLSSTQNEHMSITKQSQLCYCSAISTKYLDNFWHCGTGVLKYLKDTSLTSVPVFKGLGAKV